MSEMKPKNTFQVEKMKGGLKLCIKKNYWGNDLGRVLRLRESQIKD